MQSVERITAILVELSRYGNGARLADLVGTLGLAPASAHRLLTAMRDSGLVSQSSSDRRYFLGPLTRQLGAAALPDTLSATSGDLVRLRDYTGETVMVGQWTGDFAVCTDVVDSIQAVRPSVALGQSISLANSPAGHVLLAYLPESAGTRFQNHSQVSVDRAKLESSLETIRRDGYAEFTLIEDGDGETGVPIWSVAAPLLTRGSALAGVIAILIPSFRVAPGSTTDLLIRAATDTAMKISRGLGYRDGR